MSEEFKKMRSGELYSFADSDVEQSIAHSQKLCARISQMTIYDEEYRKVLESLFPNVPQNTVVVPPIRCDHGSGVRMGENVFINYNVTFLDGGCITIGDNTKIGPNCMFLTSNHPKEFMERRKPQEVCSPIIIGEDVWMGAGVTVCPGVTIGDRTIVAAGSVVVRDLPSDVLVAGNPAVVKRKL